MSGLVLDGHSLSTRALYTAALDATVDVSISAAARAAIHQSRIAVERWIDEGRVVYGLTTGFGEFANVTISRDHIAELQVNLIRSHSAGVGELLPASVVRAMMILRVNALARGFSGIRPETLDVLVAMINANLIPDIPSQGSVGSSGDLTPLSHLALAMIGEGWIGGRPSAEVLREHSIESVKLQAKEGLALINGTQMMTAFGALAVERIRNLCEAADVAGALSADVLRCTDEAFDERLHRQRPHPGQQRTAQRLRQLLANSPLRESHRLNDNRVQDAYSIRCMPQVHGASRDALEYAAGVITTEVNSVTDNPLIFADDDIHIQGGNFHGQPVALVLDFLAIAASELANISERRTERMVNRNLGNLPPFLTTMGGLHSGLMIAQYTAASLVSENKVLCHPASVDSIPTSANQEDHNSMGSIAGRKLWSVVNNVAYVIAIELLCASRAIELLRPLKSSAALEAVVSAIRKVVPYREADAPINTDIKMIKAILEKGDIVEAAAL